MEEQFLRRSRERRSRLALAAWQHLETARLGGRNEQPRSVDVGGDEAEGLGQRLLAAGPDEHVEKLVDAVGGHVGRETGRLAGSALDVPSMHAGLAELDATSRARFGRSFTESSAEEQLALVRELDDQLPATGSNDEMPEGFYPTLKRLVIVGYFTTETGASQTGYRITPGTFQGCVAPGGAR